MDDIRDYMLFFLKMNYTADFLVKNAVCNSESKKNPKSSKGNS